jgi:hypothetical protein
MLSTDLSRAWSHPAPEGGMFAGLSFGTATARVSLRNTAKPAVPLGHAGSFLALQGVNWGAQHVQRRPRSYPTAPTTWLAGLIIAAAARRATIPGHTLTALYAPCVTSLLPFRAAETVDRAWRQPPRPDRTPRRLVLRTARMAWDWPPGLQTRRCPWLADRVEWRAVTLRKSLNRSRIDQGSRLYTHFLSPTFALSCCVPVKYIDFRRIANAQGSPQGVS